MSAQPTLIDFLLPLLPFTAIACAVGYLLYRYRNQIKALARRVFKSR